MATTRSIPAKRSVRWPLSILILSFFAVWLLDDAIFSPSRFALESVASATRTSFFAGMSGTAMAALGFFSATIAILVSLDPKRPIVADVRRGEAMTLLIVNILTGCLWTLFLAGLSVAGWLLPRLGSSHAFSWIYEAIGTAAFLEFLVGGIFFAFVTIKVARYD